MFKTKAIFSGFSVDNLQKEKAFYRDSLGLRVEDNPMGLLDLHIEGSNAVLVYPKPNHTPASFTVLNFPVEDIDEAVDELTLRGVTMERYEGFDMDEKGISWIDGEGPSIAWFRDSAGNILSVLEME